MSFLRLLGAAGVLLLVLASPAAAHKRHHHHHHKPKDVKVQLLALNDFHGASRPTTTGGIRPPTPAGQPAPAPIAGGRRRRSSAATCSELRKGHRNSLTVAAGDLIGASPLLSALYHDEPTIEAMNLLGLDLTSVGNHEFDEGENELKRMQSGGCHPTDGCQDGTGFAGANFKYLSANVIDKRTGKPFFKPYAIRRFQGKKIGFIGMTLEGTPGIVSPAGITAPEVPRRGRHRQPLRAGAPAPRASRRSSCCCTRAASSPSRSTPTTINTCTGFTGDDHRHRRAHDEGRRPVHHRPHARGVQLRDRRPAGHERELERAARDRPRADARAARPTSRPCSADNIPMYAAGRTPQANVQALVDRYDELSAPLRSDAGGQDRARTSRATRTPTARARTRPAT